MCVCCQSIPEIEKRQHPAPKYLSSLSTDATSQLDILGHDGNTLGMDGAEIGVLKQTNQVCFSSLLEGQDSRGLEAEVRLEILGHLTDQALKGSLANEQVSRLLVLADLTKGNSSRTIAMGLLDSSCGGSGLASSLGWTIGVNRKV